MFYNGNELAREIKFMIRSIIYEDTQYIEVFEYESIMEYSWKSYEEIDYPALINFDIGCIKQLVYNKLH